MPIGTPIRPPTRNGHSRDQITPVQILGSDCRWPHTEQNATSGAAVCGGMACNQKPSDTSA